jgi:hypothetical protein
MAVVHWPFVRRLPGRLRSRVDSPTRRFASWPVSPETLGYVVVHQVSFGIALYRANSLQGGPTAFLTAFTFFQLPYGVVAASS